MEVVHELIFADAGDVSASTPLRPLRRDPAPDPRYMRRSQNCGHAKPVVLGATTEATIGRWPMAAVEVTLNA